MVIHRQLVEQHHSRVEVQPIQHPVVEQVVDAEARQVLAEALVPVEVLPLVALEVSVRRVQAVALEQDL